MKIVGGEISDAGFDVDEKEYDQLAKRIPISEIRKMKHACSIDIADKVLDLAIDNTNNDS